MERKKYRLTQVHMELAVFLIPPPKASSNIHVLGAVINQPQNPLESYTIIIIYSSSSNIHVVGAVINQPHNSLESFIHPYL